MGEQEVFEICNQVDSFIAKELTESIVIGTSYDIWAIADDVATLRKHVFNAYKTLTKAH